MEFPSTSVLFSGMYRPPGDNEFLGLLRGPLGKAWLKSSHIILLGDFNCDLSVTDNPGGSLHLTRNNSHKLCSIFDAFNMQNIVEKATRTTPTSSTLLDLIVTSRKDLVSFTGVFPPGISDHNLT